MTLSGIEAKIYAELATINRHGEDIHKTVTIKIGRDEYTYNLIDQTPINSNDKGYQGYLYQDTKTGDLYVVHGGSQSLAPADKPWTSENRAEIAKDYYDNVAKSITNKEIPPQFEEGYNFLNSIINDKKYNGLKITQLGQSLGGELAQIYGAMKEFQNIDTFTFNAVGAANLADVLSSNNIELSGDYSNIKNYRYDNELITTIAPHFGDMYSSDYKDFGLDFFHNMEVYKKNQDLTFTKDENFKTILEKLGDVFTLSLLPTDLGLKLILTPNAPINISDANEILKAISAMLQGILSGEYEDTPVLKGYISIDKELYEIQPGDTIWGICNDRDIDLEELLKLNPWLRDRFSEDGKFALIRPGEKLRIPLNNKTELLEYNPTYNKWVEIAGDVAKIVDPMFLDLNGDGKMGTTSLENGINFDHAKDGFKELSAWVDKEDGILVIDKNENGIIDDGGEIFGDNYIKSNGNKAANGFEALTDLDSNKDGIINSSDKEFDKIKVLKGDGTLVSLTELGIVSISLNKTTVNEADENGNVLVYKGTYTKEDGTTGSLGTFNLIVDKMMSEEVNKVEVSEDVASLPNIKGYGTVHSLHQAMMLDETGELKAA